VFFLRAKYKFFVFVTQVKTAEYISTMTPPAITNDSRKISSIAILRRHILCDCLVLVKQYRPALKSFTLEFPVKTIVSKNDLDHEDEAAIQDVEEDTGYSSSVVNHISPETALDPGMCSYMLIAILRNV